METRHDQHDGDRQDHERRQDRLEIEHDARRPNYSEQGRAALLRAIENHALHILNILDDARGDVSRLAIIEVADRQLHELVVQISPNIDEYFLLERIIDANTSGIEEFLEEETGRDRSHCPPEIRHFPARQNFIDYVTRHQWNDQHKSRARDGQGDGQPK